MKRNFSGFRISSLILALTLALSMAACGTDPETTKPDPSASTTAPAVPETTIPETAPPETTVPETTVPGPFNEGLDELRQRMEPSGAVAGVLYLGYTEKTITDPGFFHDLYNQAALLENPFILEIPENHFVKREGGQVFCIVPADPKSEVFVNIWDSETNEVGDYLYASTSGEPLLIQGNVSDIMPNLCVSIGYETQPFLPYISLRDGSVVLPETPMIMDFTNAPGAPIGQAGDSLDILRAFLEPSDPIACVIFLGTTDLAFGDEAYWENLSCREILGNNPFIREIPLDRCFTAEGREVYCIVPAAPDSTITVYAWDEFNGIPGEVLFTGENGEPVLLQGNVSDILPNLCVSVADSQGRLLEYYQPQISMRDGLVAVPQDPPVMDYQCLVN